MPTIVWGHGNGRRNRLPHLAGSIVWRSRWGRRFACRWKLISIAHPNPENGYAPGAVDNHFHGALTLIVVAATGQSRLLLGDDWSGQSRKYYQFPLQMLVHMCTPNGN